MTIEDNVFVGPNVTFTNDLVPRSKKYPETFEKTLLKKGSSIGANATLIAGIRIGENALIGAGAVVTKSVGKNEVWVGNPARHVGYVSTEGALLDLKLFSKKLNRQYIWSNNNIIQKNK